MPKKPSELEAQSMEEVPLGEGVIKPELPVIRCKVVYLGAMKNKSISLPGRVIIERFERPGEDPVELKHVTDGGMTCYDFSTHGVDGKLIVGRSMPDSAPPSLKGRPFTTCDHIEHLQTFFLAKGADGEREYEVLAKPEDRTVIQEYIRRSMRSRRAQEQLFSDVLA